MVSNCSPQSRQRYSKSGIGTPQSELFIPWYSSPSTPSVATISRGSYNPSPARIPGETDAGSDGDPARAAAEGGAGPRIGRYQVDRESGGLPRRRARKNPLSLNHLHQTGK